MPEDLTFMMGKFAAALPADLRYTNNHMWCQPLPPLTLPSPPGGEGKMRFGFTAYAVRLMQDVYFLDWVVSGGDRVQHLQQIGHIETSKAVSDLFAPLTGMLVCFNQELLNDPSPINLDNYSAGWLFEMAGDPAATLTPAEYFQFLTDNWDKTQRMLKGQVNLEEE